MPWMALALAAGGVLLATRGWRAARDARQAGAGPGQLLVVFDGRCRMCARSVRFIDARDPTGRFTFTPSGSATARQSLAPRGIDPEAPGSLVLVEPGGAFVKSTGALRIAARLRRPWSWLALLLGVPRSLRDPVYALVARLRYVLFRPTDACGLLPEELRRRILL